MIKQIKKYYDSTEYKNDRNREYFHMKKIGGDICIHHDYYISFMYFCPSVRHFYKIYLENLDRSQDFFNIKNKFCYSIFNTDNKNEKNI